MFPYTESFNAGLSGLCFLYEKHFLQEPFYFPIPGIIPHGKVVPKFVYHDSSTCQPTLLMFQSLLLHIYYIFFNGRIIILI